jgi:hypothetical protein
MNLNPQIKAKHLISVAAVALVVLIGYKAFSGFVQNKRAEAERFQQQVTVQATMPTADEAVKLAILEAKSKFGIFEIVSTNVAPVAEKTTYRGQKRGGAAEDALDRRMFGAAYDTWSSGDSFTRLETNWVCDLIVTHTKPKPSSAMSVLVKSECSAVQYSNEPPGLLFFDVSSRLDRQYSRYEIVHKEYYKVERVVGGRLMKPVNTESGLAYVWDTEERNKYYTEPTWVLVVVASKLKPKNQ